MLENILENLTISKVIGIVIGCAAIYFLYGVYKSIVYSDGMSNDHKKEYGTPILIALIAFVIFFVFSIIK